jgi:hypothetical protein
VVVEAARETYYTPRRVRYWIERWKELQELACPTAGAIRYDKIGSLPEGMRMSDPTRYVDVVADIERAWIHLGGRWSLQVQMVERYMQGYDLGAIAGWLRVRPIDADEATERACRLMAEYLGWRG